MTDGVCDAALAVNMAGVLLWPISHSWGKPRSFELDWDMKFGFCIRHIKVFRSHRVACVGGNGVVHPVKTTD